VLQVADDGPGVAAADRAKLGARFQRFASQAVEGVGLGLSIVQRIADLHDAELAFGDGLNGRGLCVSLRFAVSRTFA
jgi:signal transduction histidine kinase